MKVVSYLHTVPARNTKPQKEQLLRDFITGVNATGDQGELCYERNIIPSDVNVIQGWIYDQTHSPHLALRKQIIQSNIPTITADANLFLYHNHSNPWGYLRYSYNGIFPTTGEYCDTVIDRNRWNKIQQTTGIRIEPYKTTGNHILLMAQRNGGWSMKGLSVLEWLEKTIFTIQQYSDRPIIIRGHPGDKRARDYLGKGCRLLSYKNVSISPSNKPLETDLQGAWAVINHNSSAAVGPAIKGYNIFLTDHRDSQCREIANTNLNQIETPQQFDRNNWCQRISMSHWNFEELRSGECWKHMREFT
jgi:hypothetical protein